MSSVSHSVAASGSSHVQVTSHNVDLSSVPPSSEFGFPFPPYPCQEDFMREMYHVLEEGKIGIFESPTGTGKSLSLLCASFKWLSDHLEEQQRALSTPLPATEPLDWVAEHCRKREAEDLQRKHSESLEREARRLKRAKALRGRSGSAEQLVRTHRQASPRKPHSRKRTPVLDPKGKYSLEDEDLEIPGCSSDEGAQENGELSLLKQGLQDEEEEEEAFKIYFCSRTHSQLAQVIREFRRTCYSGRFRSMSLASRATLCTNPEVYVLGSAEAINDRCSELLNKKGCPFLEDESQLLFKDQAVTQVLDIEELASLGRGLGACSYFGTRRSKRSCHLVTLPYSSLVNEGTRQSLGVDLTGSVVIFDEAHNLVDAINANHSASLTLSKLVLASEALSAYLDRYQSMLSEESVAQLGNLLRWMDALLQFMQMLAGEHTRKHTSVISLNDFLFRAGIPDIDTFQVLRFMQRKQLVRKMNGFLIAKKTFSEGKGSSGDPPSTSVSNPMYAIKAFLESLTHPSHAGCMSIEVSPGEEDPVRASFVLFNPDSHIAPILRDARAVILAGGTMQPVDEVVSSLLCSVDPARVHMFSCDHIVPKENVLCVTLASGPASQCFKLVHGDRESLDVIRDLGNVIVNICKVVPDGVVCFFPSYGYESTVWAAWEDMGLSQRIAASKKVFREPRSAKDVEKLLALYTDTVQGNCGALLSCVVSGKMSEGINFQDQLARAVVVVGMPFPNAKEAVLQERLQYIAKRRGSKDFADQAYENMCMKAVNQCIGRAIRNIKDYAAIVLVDARYQEQAVRSKLPAWIQRSTQNAASYGAAHRALAEFFRGRQ